MRDREFIVLTMLFLLCCVLDGASSCSAHIDDHGCDARPWGSR